MIKSSTANPFLIRSLAQQYHWGKVGKDSLVARLLGDYKQDQPYAELWIGAHPECPSVAQFGGETSKLNDLIKADPKRLLGGRVYEQFGPSLPFLFKVLSIEKPLSIQAHPSKSLAEKLHSTLPNHYKDDNHKPEIAIAVADGFECLYGFKPWAEFLSTVVKHPEYELILGNELFKRAKLHLGSSSTDKAELRRAIIAALLRAEPKAIAQAARDFIDRNSNSAEPECTLFRTCVENYGLEDKGLFVAMLMNQLTLNAGEGIYIGPNVVHAYLKGDIVECMANSNNVVRAGLTPKFIDVDTLLGMLSDEDDKICRLTPRSMGLESGSLLRYSAPVPEFVVDLVQGACSLEKDLASDGVTLFFCLDGVATLSVANKPVSLTPGDGLIIPGELASQGVLVQGVKGRLFRVSVPLFPGKA